MILELAALTQIANPKPTPQPPEPTAIVEILKPKEEPKIYKVSKGDTLTKIAKKNKTTVKRLYYKNKNIKNQDILEVGMKLVIPHKSDKLKPRPFVKTRVGNIATQKIKTHTEALNGSNTYEIGQCTHWVASHRYVPNGWGDATNWKYAAQRAGWTVSSRPVAGAIGWTYGHVVYVQSVQSNTVTISEQNYDWNSGVRTITVPITKYLYLY